MSTTELAPDVLRVREVAEAMRMSQAHVLGLIKAGQIPTIDSGGRTILVPAWVVDAWKRGARLPITWGAA